VRFDYVSEVDGHLCCPSVSYKEEHTSSRSIRNPLWILKRLGKMLDLTELYRGNVAIAFVSSDFVSVVFTESHLFAQLVEHTRLSDKLRLAQTGVGTYDQIVKRND
jgi:hypothetical protein